VTPENFENQRQTVMEERRERIDSSPYGLSAIRVNELSYDCWAYSHPVIGTWEDLENVSFEDVVNFHRLWYRPDNAVLSVAGDFEPAETLEQIERLFGDIKPGSPRPAPEVIEPIRESSSQHTMVDPLAKLPAVFINHQAPGYGHPDFFVYEVIETVLFRGQSSWVFRKLVHDDGSAVQISGLYEAHRGPSLFGLFAVAGEAGDLDRIVDGYRAELHRLCHERVPAWELERAVNQLRAMRVFHQESALRRAIATGQSVLFHGDPLWESHYLDRVGRVTAEDILRVAENGFSDDRRVELRVLTA